jgi:acetolactate synthase-1/2/3 large subunit
VSARTPLHAGEAVAEALRDEGVRTVYSVPGSHIHPIYDGLSRIESIRFVTCKQESNVSLMADAYGRLTGEPGVCLVTRDEKVKWAKVVQVSGAGTAK